MSDTSWMTKEKYIQVVRRMRGKIEKGGQRNLDEAECGLKELEGECIINCVSKTPAV